MTSSSVSCDGRPMRYHTVFRHFDGRTIECVKSLQRNWSNLTDDEKVQRLNDASKTLSVIYRVKQPKIGYSHHCGNGFYDIVSNRITLPKTSIVTFLHEFRHAMQRQGKASYYYNPEAPSESRGGVENDARAWSLSLYHRVAPRTLKRLVSEGQVFFISPNDLT